MSLDKKLASGFLKAAFQPVASDHIVEENLPEVKTNSISSALDRLDREATEFENMVTHGRPFKNVVKDIVERMR